MSIKLTAYSHGAGCGCKLSPAVLSEILSGSQQAQFQDLLVGNHERDDAAVYNLDGKTAIISTTDFFMPIVDDPTDFGGIAAVNAISDIYAMGGTPMMALAILGWPIDKISTEMAREVLNGAKYVCSDAGIPLAGGHSIDAPEPIFGLAVTGSAPVEVIKRNSTGKEGDYLYLTKPIGVGLITTAQKKGIAREEDLELAKKSMLTLNKLGVELAQRPEVHAMTDVTGFGLGGHLIEMAEGSELSAVINHSQIPLLSCTDYYLDKGTSPGGTSRNWQSYGSKVDCSRDYDHRIIADPQTSGGLLVSVDPQGRTEFEKFASDHGYQLKSFGQLVARNASALKIRD